MWIKCRKRRGAVERIVQQQFEDKERVYGFVERNVSSPQNMASKFHRFFRKMYAMPLTIGMELSWASSPETMFLIAHDWLRARR